MKGKRFGFVVVRAIFDRFSVHGSMDRIRPDMFQYYFNSLLKFIVGPKKNSFYYLKDLTKDDLTSDFSGKKNIIILGDSGSSICVCKICIFYQRVKKI